MRISKKLIIMTVCAVFAAVILSILLAVMRNRAEAQKKLQFAEDGLLAEIRSSPLWDGGQGAWVFYDTVYQVYNDGKQMYFAENFQDGYTVDLPPVVSQLSKEEVLAIQKAIEDNKFMELGGMSNPAVCDGSSVYVTVYTAGQSHTSGGNNPFNVEGIERFDAVCAAIHGSYTEEELTYRRQVDQILKKQYEGADACINGEAGISGSYQ